MKRTPKPTAHQVAREWDRAAPTREEQVSTGLDKSAIETLGPNILRLLKPVGQTVIDIGCGTGWLTARFSRRAKSVLGIDPSAVSIEIANQRYLRPNVKYVQTTIERFARRNQANFTAAVANMTLSTAPNLSAVMRSTARVLKRGAPFVFSIPHPCFFPEYWGYADAAWFRYDEEVPIAAQFRIRSQRTALVTTHIHRPISMYLNALVSAGFVTQHCVELQGRGFTRPRFLIIRAIAAK